ncbi:hypothetical protein LCGC14_0019490 [marine sediment metagenome]|uniref:Uncharacterized protein n=1 Tax=marine sediment metagenome TaxID=412755 RepID=A0A0F9WG76_9ZZZZ|nr:extracellular solute-binding protein [Phycisphaerae bacterium]HDZ43057.1 extracellular solute-binding protein [Phycisphaerae bacterium]
MTRRAAILCCVALAAVTVAGCRSESRDAATDSDAISGDLILFHAGSLTVPLQEVSKLFMARYPGVTVKAEAAGSRQCARKISDLGRPGDVFASADYRVAQNLLMLKFARFNIRFAANEMVIAYTDRSIGGESISTDNWPEIVLRRDVACGRSDPNSDPCGYRTLMMFQLAERHYGIDHLADKLAGRRWHIRPKETDLLVLLEMGEIDYLFIYRSVAAQHGLKMVLLPDEVNLRSPVLAEVYRSAAVPVTGKRPGETITRVGEPIVYSVTIPTTAENPKAAEAYIALLLSPAGQAIMARHGQPSVDAVADEYDNLPPVLQALCTPAGPAATGTHDDDATVAPAQR